MSFPRLWTLHAFCTVVLCLCLFLQFWTETVHQRRRPPEPVRSVEVDRVRPPILGIVVALSVEEVTFVVESLERWSSRCSGTTLDSVDLILYFAGDLPAHEPERHFSSPCFSMTRMVSASIYAKDIPIQEMRSAQFYKLFLAPTVRASFVDYDALAILDWDIIIAQDMSFKMLYSAAFTADQSYWVKGSRLAEMSSEEKFASPELLGQLPAYLDGNAIYNNTDREFVDFVHFSLNRWKFTRSYDVALWATVSENPYNRSLWQRFASKFVATNMVSALKRGDLEDEDAGVTNVIAPDVLFLRRRAGSPETLLNKAEQEFRGCQEACGSRGNPMNNGVLSTVCDATCVEDSSWMGVDFNGLNCGVGNPSKYGESCRLCFGDQAAALKADQALAALTRNASTPPVHVIMCETKRPPEAVDCPRECEDDINTICDKRCGSGIYGDWGCNWQGLGENCRFCSLDIVAAWRMDATAQEAKGRVIMCETHEPPHKIQETGLIGGAANLVHGVDQVFVESNTVEEPSPDMDDAATPFIGDIVRGNICAFIPGYFDFIHETRLAVDAVLHFMPGVRVAIATHPKDYHVFHRALGGRKAAISVVNDTRVSYASLAADEACGNETRLIYYMTPGEVLTRAFTPKDTHTQKGDLIVTHSDVDIFEDGKSSRRFIGTAARLGFHGLSLTYGSDLILPAEMNLQLRAVMRSAIDASIPKNQREVYPRESFSTCEFHRLLDSMSGGGITYASIFIPELLAGLLYMQSPMGVHFIDTTRDRRHSFSVDSAIWDVPLVKPRFGCSIDLDLSVQGYDVAHQLGKHVEAFRNGERCERGVIEVDQATLELKNEWEFPLGYPTSRMPPLGGFRISVMYRTFSGDMELVNASISTAIRCLPEALEIVVVVEEVDKDLAEEMLVFHRKSAPFPLRVVAEPSLMDGHIQQKYSKIRADLYTEGDYILHLDSDVFIYHEVKYENIFHLGKPVLPFRRYREEIIGLTTILCWQNSTSSLVGEDVAHEFSVFNTHVYPRQMYPALRKFVEERHGKSFEKFMSTRVGKCSNPDGLAKWSTDMRERLLSDFNLMGAFLWYHMADAVYWMPADPYDLRMDQKKPDFSKYNWVCQANGRLAPKDAAGKAQYRDDFMRVTSPSQCRSVTQYWKERYTNDVKARTPVP